MSELDIEIDFFNQYRKEWFKHHAGKWALIKGTTIHDFYDTSERAYEVGLEVYGLETSFLIQKVQLIDTVIFMNPR